MAVDDVSFKVETGKVTGFLRPNGAGKSTIMRLMFGLDSGTGGYILDTKLKIEFKDSGDGVTLFETRPLQDILADIADGWNNTQRSIGRLRASVATEVSYVM